MYTYVYTYIYKYINIYIYKYKYTHTHIYIDKYSQHPEAMAASTMVVQSSCVTEMATMEACERTKSPRPCAL